MAGILDIISGFTTLPGPKQRFEAQQAARMDELNRMSSARIAEMKAGTEEDLFKQRQMEQQKNEALHSSLERNFLAQGMPQQEATAMANRTLAEMQVANPYQAMSSAELATKRNQGAMPAAGQSALTEEQAKGAKAEGDIASDIARKNIEQERGRSEPGALRAKNAAMQKDFANQGTAADARAQNIAEMTSTGDLASISENRNKISGNRAISDLIPGAARQEFNTKLALGKQAEMGATQDMMTTPPNAAVLNNKTARLAADTAKSTFEAANPAAPIMKGYSGLDINLLAQRPDAIAAVLQSLNKNNMPTNNIPRVASPGSFKPEGQIDLFK